MPPLEPSNKERDYVRKLSNGISKIFDDRIPIDQCEYMLFDRRLTDPPQFSWDSSTPAYNQLVWELLSAIQFWNNDMNSRDYTPVRFCEAAYEYLRQYMRTVQGFEPVIYAQRPEAPSFARVPTRVSPNSTGIWDLPALFE